MAQASIQFQEGFRIFTPKSIQVRVVRLSSDQMIQTGEGLQRAMAGSFIITLPSGQQFPLSEANFNDCFEGLSDGR